MSTVAADCINFIDKNKARSILLSLLKHIANSTCPNPHKHFHEIRTTNREERDFGFTRNRARQQGLTSSWRPNHKNTLRYRSAKSLKLLRISKKIDNLEKFFFCLLDSSNIFKRHLLLVHGEELRFGLTKTHRPTPGRLHLMSKKKENQND